MSTFDPHKTVFIVDASSFLYRAYYGLKPLHTPQGVPVQAVYSFCRMLKHLVDRFGPQYLVLVWDSYGKTERHHLYPAYKATRQAAPSDLGDQKKLIMQFADLIGVKQLAREGVEADDLMYSLSVELAQNNITSVLVTSDKDMGQVLRENVYLFDPAKDQIVDPVQFEKMTGFPPSKLCFYFSLLGDTSDNIPGVKGIGKKGALELVTQFADLADLYARIDEVRAERTKTALRDNKENAFLSGQLFALRYYSTDLKVPDLVFDVRNWEKADTFFRELNFKSMLKEASSETAKQKAEPATVENLMTRLAAYEFVAVTTESALDELCAQLRAAGRCALDTETDGVSALQAQLVGVSVCFKKGRAYYIPVGHVGFEQLPRELVLEKLRSILEDAQYPKYLHNAKFDAHVFFASGVTLRGIAFDSYIAARLILPEWHRAGLKYLSVHYLNEPMISHDDVMAATKARNFTQVPLELATRYAAADAHQTWQLVELLTKELAKDEVIAKLFENVEFPLIQLLTAMEQEGMALDVKRLKELSVLVERELVTIEDTLRMQVGSNMPVNLNSPKQIEELLFKRLMLPPQKKSAKGTSFSTDQSVLAELAKIHPVPGLILKYRELAKLRGTYIEGLPAYVNPKTGRIHTTFSQVATATGRMASSDPNMQNIPADGSEYGLEVRGAFLPKPGDLFVSADYSQMELRVLAHLSNDANLINAFLSGADIHAHTAAHIFGVPLEQVEHSQRKLGKVINFSILYGKTPYGLSKDLSIPLKEAKGYIDAYFAQYPAVLSWIETVVEETKTHDYVQTLWGRRRHIPGIHEKNRALYEEARRVAVNTKVQGTAADIMKLGMLKTARSLAQAHLDAQLVLQIHDELVLTVRTGAQDAAVQLVKKELEGVVDWQVPMRVTTRVGASWKEITK